MSSMEVRRKTRSTPSGWPPISTASPFSETKAINQWCSGHTSRFHCLARPLGQGNDAKVSAEPLKQCLRSRAARSSDLKGVVERKLDS